MVDDDDDEVKIPSSSRDTMAGKDATSTIYKERKAVKGTPGRKT